MERPRLCLLFPYQLGTGEHLKRLVTIAASYTDKQSRYYGNEVLYNAIRDALQYWVKQDPTCFNWWYNQISVPQTQASLLALMDAGQRNFRPKSVCLF